MVAPPKHVAAEPPIAPPARPGGSAARRARPRPPGGSATRPAAAPPLAAASVPGLRTYQPGPDDPGASSRGSLAVVREQHAPGKQPKRRKRRKIRVALLLIAALTVGLVLLRAGGHDGSGRSGHGVAYTSATGHFTARFAAQPSEHTDRGHFGKVRVVYHLALVPDASSGVTEADLSERVAAPGNALLHTMVRGLAGSGRLTLVEQHRLTVGGRRARQVDYYVDADGRMVSVLFVGYSAKRYYAVLAPSGSAFDDLKGSFATLP